ncbi:hypothetical protein RND81_03G059900 [Saponaria officinalis]|uniref:MRN complex-interacting protein N-terminal domain-containing protein n=1 Tax=Saponaria officinalis TaxID=3572 RepID=A0AAW1LYG0_SAPOF
MSKSTLFIAVQCHQCSTMQVKQQKKSSNKWNCAVCNEKQSVRKVYAQGYQAKDIRHVVQSFNMSRMFTDDRKCQESSSGHFIEHVEGEHGTAVEIKAGKRRSDWSEYVDFDKDSLEPAYLKSQLQEEQMTEQKVVTELPEELMFKKPKLKGNFTSSSLKKGGNPIYKPQFHKKTATKELTQTRGRNDVKFNVDNGDHSTDISSQRLQKSKGIGMTKTGASRWAEYMTEDDGFPGEENDAAFLDNLRVTDAYKEQNDGADLLVEEDIHPDFM